MSMQPYQARLAGITRELLKNWQHTQTVWKDSRATEFGEKYLTELFSSVETTHIAIDQLDAIISKIRKDCE